MNVYIAIRIISIDCNQRSLGCNNKIQKLNVYEIVCELLIIYSYMLIDFRMPETEDITRQRGGLLHFRFRGGTVNGSYLQMHHFGAKRPRRAKSLGFR